MHGQDLTVPQLPNPMENTEGQNGTIEVQQDLIAPPDDCAICFNQYERPVMTPCRHWFCMCAPRPWHSR